MNNKSGIIHFRTRLLFTRQQNPGIRLFIKEPSYVLSYSLLTVETLLHFQQLRDAFRFSDEDDQENDIFSILSGARA